MTDKKKVEIEITFYRSLGIKDPALLENIEQGISLYMGAQDKKAGDAVVNFEKSLGMLSVCYAKIAHALIREDWRHISDQQRLFLDFGVIDARLMQNKRILGELTNELGKPSEEGEYSVYYLSEWLDKISRGAINLTSDAAQSKVKTHDNEVRDRVLKKVREIENILNENFRKEHEGVQHLTHLFNIFDPKAKAIDKAQIMRGIRQHATDLESILKEQAQKESEIEVLNTRLGLEDKEFSIVMDERRADQYRRLRDEFDMLITIIRSCAVRGGIVKSTPALIDRWIPLDSRVTTNTKETISSTLSQIEEIDFTVFKNKAGRRLPPNIVILPGIGTGMAWPDRIMLSMFTPPTIPPDIAVIRTLAQYRWYIATSSYKWQDIPGELGSSYQVLYPDKFLTTLQKAFIEDYEKWMTKESQGFQVLSPEVRKLFWRQIPFSDKLKENLSGRAVAYKQLHAAEKAKGR